MLAAGSPGNSACFLFVILPWPPRPRPAQESPLRFSCKLQQFPCLHTSSQAHIRHARCRKGFGCWQGIWEHAWCETQRGRVTLRPLPTWVCRAAGGHVGSFSDSAKGRRRPRDRKPEDASAAHTRRTPGTGFSCLRERVLYCPSSVRRGPLLLSPPLCFEVSALHIPNQLLAMALQEGRLCLAHMSSCEKRRQSLNLSLIKIAGLPYSIVQLLSLFCPIQLRILKSD